MGIDEETLNVLIGEYASSYGGEIEITKESCDKSHFTVHFSGRMCRSCGIEEYFDGFAHLLRLGGIHARVESLKKEKGGYTVTYKLRD